MSAGHEVVASNQRSELKATIDHGDAAGDELIAQVEAGLLTFKLKLFALPAAN